VLSLPLSGLGADAVAQILESIWDTAPLPGLATFIYERSDGIPLFAEELALFLLERFRGHASNAKAWNEAMRERGISTLQDLVGARLASLGQLRRLAQTASVIGRDFSFALLSQIAGRSALPCSLEDSLQKLIRAGILRRGATGSSSTYRFRHVLIHEAAHESMLKADRRQLHARIVRLVTEGAVPALSDEIVAWHFEQAGQPLEAARYAIRAAEGCVARSAVHEADQLLDFARKQLDQCDAAMSGVEDLLLQLLAVRGPVAAALSGRGSAETRAIYEQGVALCAARGDQDRAKWFPLYWGWWFTAPDYETQRERSKILLRDLESSADPEVRLQSLHCAWATNFDAGLHSFCLKCVETGLTLYDEDRARRSRVRYGGHDAKVCAFGERALSLWFMGDTAGSADSMNAAMRWAEHINHLDSTLHALGYGVGLKRYQNDYLGVVELADRIATVGTEHGLPGAITKAKLFRGWARALTGAVADGLTEFEEGFDLQRQIGTGENVSSYGGMQAEILERAGRFEEAFETLDRTIAASMRSGQVFWLAALHRTRALLRQALGHGREDVVADLRRALDVASEQGALALASRIRGDVERLGLSSLVPNA
jgi:predicted ATPase